MNEVWSEGSETEYFSAEEEDYYCAIKNQEEFQSEVTKLRKDLSQLEKIKKQLQGKVDKVKIEAYENDLDNYDKVLVQFNSRLQHIEQYSRLNSALFHLRDLNDIPKIQSEKNMVQYACNKINEKVNLNFVVTPGYIDTAHLLRRKDKNNKSPILIVKFVNRWPKNEVLSSKDVFRADGVAVTEHLCEQRLELLKEAQRRLGRKNVYTDQCVIYVKSSKGERKIRNFDDIEYYSNSLRRQ